MLLYEFDNSNIDSGKLAALVQFLLGRAQDTDAQKKISVSAFIKLAQNMGISINSEQLIELSQQPPLNNLIQNIENDQVVFKGSEDPNVTMPVDQAQATVDKMAKRAATKGL